MMKRIVAICTLVMVAYTIAAAQPVSVMFHVGGGTFGMSTQKELQDDVRGSDIPWRPVHEFPPYWIYGGSLSFNFNPRFGASACIEYGSTGGRLDYSDYSGSAQFDQLLRYTQIGVGLFLQINQSENWPLFATGHVLLGKTKETLSYALHVGYATEEESETLHSTNIGLRPGVMLQHRVGAFLFQGNMGFEIQSPGKLKNENGNSLVLRNGEDVTAQWTGLRATLGIGLVLGKRKISPATM